MNINLTFNYINIIPEQNVSIVHINPKRIYRCNNCINSYIKFIAINQERIFNIFLNKRPSRIEIQLIQWLNFNTTMIILLLNKKFIWIILSLKNKYYFIFYFTHKYFIRISPEKNYIISTKIPKNLEVIWQRNNLSHFWFIICKMIWLQ